MSICMDNQHIDQSLSKKLSGLLLNVHIHYGSEHSMGHKPHQTNFIIKYAEYITDTHLHVTEILHTVVWVTSLHLFINLKPEI